MTLTSTMSCTSIENNGPLFVLHGHGLTLIACAMIIDARDVPNAPIFQPGFVDKMQYRIFIGGPEVSRMMGNDTFT